MTEAEAYLASEPEIENKFELLW